MLAINANEELDKSTADDLQELLTIHETFIRKYSIWQACLSELESFKISDKEIATVLQVSEQIIISTSLNPDFISKEIPEELVRLRSALQSVGPSEKVEVVGFSRSINNIIARVVERAIRIGKRIAIETGEIVGDIYKKARTIVVATASVAVAAAMLKHLNVCIVYIEDLATNPQTLSADVPSIFGWISNALRMLGL